MSPIDIAIIVIVAVLFAAAFGYVLYRKLRGKGGCDCGGDCGGCGSCSGCNGCGPDDKKDGGSCCCCNT
ncbi:MAG: hypothetical protein K2M48_05400, partial [Clostridiales bacterium]|nr:hypothetical protein [Clostridiales bacterium]